MDEKTSILKDEDIREFRRIRHLDIILWSIINEVAFFSMFLIILFVLSFANLNNSSYSFKKIFINTFVIQQNQNEVGLYNVN